MFGFIIGAISAAVSAITTALPTIATTIATVISNTFDLIKPILSTVCQALGITQPGEDLEELGGRSLQAAEHGIVPEKFTNHADYLNAVRAFDKYDPTSTKFSPEEVKAQAAVLSITGLAEKTKVSDSHIAGSIALMGLSPTHATPERFMSLITSNLNTEKAVDYFSGELAYQDNIDVKKELIAFEKEINPEKSDKEIISFINEVKDEVAATIANFDQE